MNFKFSEKRKNISEHLFETIKSREDSIKELFESLFLTGAVPTNIGARCAHITTARTILREEREIF